MLTYYIEYEFRVDIYSSQNFEIVITFPVSPCMRPPKEPASFQARPSDFLLQKYFCAKTLKKDIKFTERIRYVRHIYKRSSPSSKGSIKTDYRSLWNYSTCFLSWEKREGASTIDSHLSGLPRTEGDIGVANPRCHIVSQRP